MNVEDATLGRLLREMLEGGAQVTAFWHPDSSKWCVLVDARFFYGDTLASVITAARGAI
jgi:hypothetical protein